MGGAGSIESLGYTRESFTGRMLDPFTQFDEKEYSFEIRRDRIFGITTRMLPYRMKVRERPGVEPCLEKSPESVCPFCAGLFDRLTPRFTTDIIPEGRFTRGTAVLFPNAFPYGRHNAVALYSHRHYVPLEEFSPALMMDGFLLCLEYFHAMKRHDPELGFGSINWNYMPPAGGGMLHPHLQTVMGQAPTELLVRARASAERYRAENKRDLWDDLTAWEREAGERFIAETGPVTWLASFAPSGMAGDVGFFMHTKRSLLDLELTDLESLISGLSRVLTFLHGSNFISFNMSLSGMLDRDEFLCPQGRVVPRFTINPLGASDVNYFEKLHGEIICTVMPEDLCADLKPLFG